MIPWYVMARDLTETEITGQALSWEQHRWVRITGEHTGMNRPVLEGGNTASGDSYLMICHRPSIHPLSWTRTRKKRIDTNPMRNRLNQFVSVYTIGWAGAIMKDRKT